MAGYEQEYRRSLDDPESFWGEVAQDVRWTKRWDKVLDRSSAPLYRWFRGAELNTCFNAVDLHAAEGRAEQLALVWDSPLAGEVRKLTYRELRDEVARFAGALRRAYLPAEKEPVLFSTHGPVAAHYKAQPGTYEPHATTLDYVVAATAG